MFSPLGKLARRTIYFTFRSFFLFSLRDSYAKRGICRRLIDRFLFIHPEFLQTSDFVGHHHHVFA